MRLLALEYVHSKGSAANPDDAHLTKRLCSYKTTSNFLCTEARPSFEDTLNATLRGVSVFPTGSPVLHYARKATTPCLYAFLPLWETPLEVSFISFFWSNLMFFATSRCYIFYVAMLRLQLPSSPYRLPGYSEQNETADLLGTYVRGRIATSTLHDDTLTELGQMFSKRCSDNVADLFDIKHPSKFAALPSMSRFHALGKALLHALGAATVVTLQPPSQRALRRTLNNLELPIGAQVVMGTGLSVLFVFTPSIRFSSDSSSVHSWFNFSTHPCRERLANTSTASPPQPTCWPAQLS